MVEELFVGGGLPPMALGIYITLEAAKASL
jgi:hypothetical protein